MARVSFGILAVALVLTACTTVGTGTTTTAAPPIETTNPAPTSTVVSTTTTIVSTTTTFLPGFSTPEEYPISDDFVMETVLVDLDAATGGLALDSAGNLYTADFGYPGHDGNTVFKVAPDGTVEAFATHETMDQLTGNRVASGGTLYQSSFGSGYVYRIDPEGSVEIVTDQMDGPTANLLTDDGRLLVLDCNRNALYEVLDDGAVDVFAGGLSEGMRCPNGMTQDADGNLYVVNFNHGQLMRISPDGSDLTVLHDFPGGNAHVAHHDGNLFITARETNRIFRYEIATGDVDVIAGTGEAGFDDGPGSVATFGPPNAIVADDDGSIYFNHGDESGFNPTAIRVLRPVS